MTHRASEMQTFGNAWIKLVVPSIGSQMNVGLSVSCLPGT